MCIRDRKKGRKSEKVENKIRINSRGSIVIPKKLVETLELGNSDTFEVLKNGNGILLKKVKKRAKTILRKAAGHSAIVSLK